MEKISKAKTLLIQKIAYELRTPLNGILGYTEMLFGSYFGELNLRQKERIKDINRCGMEIGRVIDDLLDLSSADEIGNKLVKSRIMVGDLIKIPLTLLENKIRQSEVIIAQHLTNQTVEVLLDRQKVLFVIRHILDNAIRFSKRGGQVTITDEISGSGILYITIADSGHGMSPAELNTAFLYPDDENKRKSQGGIGLGLPLSQLFIHLHGGEIKIESANEIGTTVLISLPLEH